METSVSAPAIDCARTARLITGYYFLTPVWGAAYTRLFTEIAIPAQLAAGNLGAFRGLPGCQYIIYTTPNDADSIRSSSVFQALNACIPVRFEQVDEEAGSNHDKMSACYRAGIATADRAGAGILFLTPDIVFADGSFATIKRLAEGGYDTVLVPAIRTQKNRVMQALRHSRIDSTAISIAPRELMRIALDYLHPLADASWWNQGPTDLLPANLYWPVGDEGILGRCFHLHPIFIYPQRRNVTFFGTVDDDYYSVACPDSSKDYVVPDSDAFLSIELSELSHYFRTGFRKGSVEDAAMWAEQFANQRHRMLFDRVIRMHTGMRDRALWQKAEAEAEEVANAIKAKLNLPTRSLLFGGSPALVRRLIRKNMDLRLEAANSENGIFSGSLLHRFIASHVSFWLIDLYLFVIRKIPLYRRWYFGTIDRPRFYTFNHLIRGLLKKDLPSLVGSQRDILLVTENAGESILKSVLRQSKLNVSVASVFRFGDEVGLAAGGIENTIERSSRDYIIVEYGEGTNLPDALAAAHAALRPDGRILILSGRFSPRLTTIDSLPFDREAIGRMLGPQYRVVEHHKLGGAGSVSFNGFTRRFKAKARRNPIVARIIEFVLPPIWFPCFVIMNSVGRVIAWIGDRLDREQSRWLLSLTLAEKIETAQELQIAETAREAVA